MQQKVFGLRSYCFEEVLEGLSRDVAKRTDIIFSALVADEVDVFRSSDYVEDDGAK